MKFIRIKSRRWGTLKDFQFQKKKWVWSGNNLKPHAITMLRKAIIRVRSLVCHENVFCFKPGGKAKQGFWSSTMHLTWICPLKIPGIKLVLHIFKMTPKGFFHETPCEINFDNFEVMSNLWKTNLMLLIVGGPNWDPRYNTKMIVWSTKEYAFYVCSHAYISIRKEANGEK